MFSLSTNMKFSAILYFLYSLFLVTDAAADYRDKVWKNIRDTYVRAIGGRWKKSGSGTDELPKYPHLEAMSFLKPFVNVRASNAATNITPVCEENEENSTPDDSVVQEPDDADDSSDIQSSSLSPGGEDNFAITETKGKITGKQNVPKKGTKRSFSRMSQKSIDKALDVKILDYLSESGNRSEGTCISADLNGDISFGQSVAAQLSKMDKKQNAFAKAKIQMILLEVQFPGEGNPSPFLGVANYDNNYQHTGQSQRRFFVPDPRLDSPTRNPYVPGSYFHSTNQQ